MVEALRHEQLPADAALRAAPPHVDWSHGDVRLLTEPSRGRAATGRAGPACPRSA
jgi:hypothetical protein